ncbi:MAG: ABC transporter ATP-binding protein [Cyanobacteria bacterium SID2]|nr:ABC transporter ATP-binding protein [Cyanobacteria bacterium SID2]MBP0006157.1 ABC transporter ATP-binding protein [Cyanobacteria bacterium SBC]
MIVSPLKFPVSTESPIPATSATVTRDIRRAAISAQGVEMSFQTGDKTYTVLKGIDLEIERGQVQLLMGPSGSGKTTLLSILAGLLTPTSGRVHLLGEELGRMSRKALARFRLDRIGFIFQGFNLFPSLTASENVEVALNLKGIRGRTARNAAREMLEQVGLGDKAKQYPRDLSGGQKQRVAIARALVSHPEIVMADEPTAALDSQSGHEVTALLRRLAKEEGVTVLMVTHDPRIIDIADRITYLEDGQIKVPEANRFSRTL